MGKKPVKLAANFVELGWDDAGAPSLEKLRGTGRPERKAEVAEHVLAMLDRNAP